MINRGVAVLLLAVACTSQTSTERIGPLQIETPPGWQAHREGRNSLKFTDGSVASDTDSRAGDATAVFDLYLNSRHTPDSYASFVASEGGRIVRTELLTIDGESATVLDIEGESFAGHWTVVLVPDERVLVVYRAAFPNDDAAYNRGRPALLDAVRSMRFTAGDA